MRKSLFFGVITLIVIAVLPSTRPSGPDGETSATGGVQPCPQCGTGNPGESSFCTNCGAALGRQVEAPVPTPARFLTPLVGLIVGLLFALFFLQATKYSVTDEMLALGQGATQEDLERVREELGNRTPPVVLLWPVSPGLQSFMNRQSAAGLVWQRFPTTLQLIFLGGGLAVLVAWGLGLTLGRRHPGITAGRMAVAAFAAIPVFWLVLLLILVLAIYLGWLPSFGKSGLSQLLMPVFTVGILGGLWIALEMRSREAASAIVVLARSLGLVLRHGGMLISAVIFIEILFAWPGIGRLLLEAAHTRDAPVLGTAAALIIWLALLSRLLGNLLLVAVDRTTPTRTGASRVAESWSALAIGGGVTLGLLFLLLLAPFLTSQDPTEINLLESRAGPSAAHWLGNDQLGRDIFSRVLHGARTAALIGLPMGLLALLVSFPMVIARAMLDRTRSWALTYGIEGVLEGLVAIPWLVIGVLIQASLGGGWPFLALAAMLLPRALRAGWALGEGEGLHVNQLAPLALRLGALFLVAALAMSAGLGFMGLGLPQGQPDLGGMIAQGRALLIDAPLISIVPGLVLSLVTGTWLVVATLYARSGQEYIPVGWTQTMS